MLEDFVNLHNAKVVEIQRYARRFGVLGLCKHGCGVDNRWHAQQSPGCHRSSRGGRMVESVDHWRWWARFFAAILDCASALHQRTRGSLRSWAMLFPDSPLRPIWRPVREDDFEGALDDTPIDDLWDHLIFLINVAVLGQAPMQVCAVKRAGQVEMRFVPAEWNGALFAVLAIELLAAVTQSGLWYTCSNCKRWYSVDLKHKPRSGKHNYCRSETCGPKASWRKSKRRQRGLE
jgi:hypothetical protein